MIRFFLALFLFLSFSCSKVETGLNFAPRIATSRIDDAFDFDSEKLTKLRKQIDSDLQESKKSLALKIIAHIEFLEKKIESPELKLEEIVAFYDDISETQTALIKSFKSSAELVFKDISEHETKSFKEHSDKKYEEELALTKDKPEFKKKRLNNFIKGHETFLGSLTSSQKEMIESFVDKNLDYFMQRILSRQKFSEELYLKIKSKDPALDFFLTRYEGKKLSEIQDPAMKEYLTSLFQFEISLWKTVNDKQKASLKETLAGYKDEFKKISARD